MSKVLLGCLVGGALLLVPVGFAGSPLAAQEVASTSAGSEAASGEEDVRVLRDWYEMGGWIMHGILGCSVLVFGLILERAWALRRGAVIPRKLLRDLRDHLQRRETPQVLALCAASSASLARVLRAGLIHFDKGLAGMQDAVEMAGQHEAGLLRRNLPMLAALANIATMMGLLGTVLGMIESFDLIAKTGTGDARVVAGGIFQALVTTAAGLMVGITAIAFHSILRRKVEVLEADLEEFSFRMLEELSVERAEPAPVAPSPGSLAAPAEA